MNFSLNDLLSHPSHLWVLWILLALVSGIIEAGLPSFSFIFGSLAGLVAALSTRWLGIPGQVSVFAATLVLSLSLLRPRLVGRLHARDRIPSRAQVLVGKAGQVTEAIDPITGRGRVTVEGEDWAARSDARVEAGSAVTVLRSDGIVLVVVLKPT